MRYVILRDDDTNVLTPPECLERLYRPFLDAGLPVNLATIPSVYTEAKRPDGQPEGFVWRNGAQIASEFMPLTRESALAKYLRENRGYHIVQHGFHHEPFEFDRRNALEIVRRLEKGSDLLQQAGFERPQAFVAPHDKFSPNSYREVARRFRVISSGWFEARRLPFSWWPKYLLVKAAKRPHWRVNGTLLLSHPGCLLSYMRPYDSMLETVQKQIQAQQVTVIVTHWWEYFKEGQADEPFIAVLHKLAQELRNRSDVKVITFAELAARKISLN